MSMNDGDEESRLLTNLEGAMQSARRLGLRDLELILKMAVLELLNLHASHAPKQRAVRGRLKSK